MKLHQQFLVAVLLGSASLAVVNAQVIIPASDRVSTTPGVDNGLNGAYWQRPVASILVDGNANPANSISLQIDNFGPSTGTFIAHTFAHTGNDLTTAAAWLGTDGPSLTGALPTNNLDDGAFRFDGFLFVAAAGILNFGLTSDDGSRIKIGTVDILGGLNDGSHGDVTSDTDVSFSAAGLYPFRVDYFNGDWTSDGGHNGSLNPGDHGGANFTLRESFAPMTEANLYRNVPEPGSLVMGLASLCAMLALRRRRR